jgi:biopolymer transport protein ExbD
MTIPSPRSQRRARIEIVPLIDIIFFLLATFVMVSLSMVKSRGIGVTLPTSSTSTTQKLPDFSTLTITKDGSIFLDKVPVTPNELPAKLQALKSAHQGDPAVLINGDETAQLGHAIRVLDECRRQGISRVTFQTRAQD